MNAPSKIRVVTKAKHESSSGPCARGWWTIPPEAPAS